MQKAPGFGKLRRLMRQGRVDILDFGITIYDYFDPKKAGSIHSSNQNNRQSSIVNLKS